MKNLKLLVVTFLLTTLSGGVLSAQNLTVRGTVTDVTTGEAIVGATVLAPCTP